MSLDIGAAIRGGTRRLATRSALLLVAAFFLIGLLSTVATQSLNVAVQQSLVDLAESNAAAFEGAQVETLREQLRQSREGSPLAVGMPVGAAVALAFVLAFVAEATTLVAVRVFVNDTTDGIPGSLVRRNLGRATLNGFVGGVVVGVFVVLGLVALVIPGLFLYVSLLFLRQEIAVEDENFIEAMAGAWELSRGNRFELLGLAVVVLAVSLVAFVPGLVLAGIAPLVGTAVSSVLSPVVTVFGVAVTSRAYVQLKEGDDAEESTTEEEEEETDPYDRALGPDDLPEP